MTTKGFRTEAPIVVSTKSGLFKSAHYDQKSAIEAAKSTKQYRIIHGIHRGDWKPLVHFNKGVRVCPDQITSTVSGKASSSAMP